MDDVTFLKKSNQKTFIVSGDVFYEKNLDIV